MRVTALNSRSLPLYRARVERLAENSEHRWGKMTPAQMVAHLRRTVELGLGEVEGGADMSNAVTRSRFFLWFAFRIMPWPKGKLQAPPIMFPNPVRDLAAERTELLAAMERYTEADRREPDRMVRHILLGPKSLRDFEYVHGRHFDHHLTQFGV